MPGSSASFRRLPDTFEAAGELHKPSEMDRYEGFIRGLVEAGEVEMGVVRRRVAEFYVGGK